MSNEATLETVYTKKSVLLYMLNRKKKKNVCFPKVMLMVQFEQDWILHPATRPAVSRGCTTSKPFVGAGVPGAGGP